MTANPEEGGMTELAKGFPLRQWVCVPCGYNMIGEMPDVCPFCGARHDRFVSWDVGEERYRVEARDVTDGVSQLLSRPRLGLEHACYRIETDEGPVWIDCPSAFNRTLAPVGHIFFTHKDFMGASNQYRAQWNAAVHIHEAETENPLAAAFPVDDAFRGDFTSHDIEAFHIGGHTPGFTAYLWRDVLFACDYAFPPDDTMRLNPYSDPAEIANRGRRLLAIARERRPRLVAGYSFVVPGEAWTGWFEAALERAA